MPYQRNADLPKAVKSHVPKHGQDIFRKAYNSALDQYNGEESRAARVAWNAVKSKYEKGEDGDWHRTRS